MIRTTLEHPFRPVGREWTRAGELGIGELLVTLSGVPIAVEAIRSTGEVATVYNLEVEEHHTYFVTGHGWGLAVWAHNARCWVQAETDSMAEAAARGCARDRFGRLLAKAATAGGRGVGRKAKRGWIPACAGRTVERTRRADAATLAGADGSVGWQIPACAGMTDPRQLENDREADTSR